MKFHKERMSIINRMIRDMWHSTYKGKDIDYVEIQADPSKETCNLLFTILFILILYFFNYNFSSCPPAIQLSSRHGKVRCRNGYAWALQCRAEGNVKNTFCNFDLGHDCLCIYFSRCWLRCLFAWRWLKLLARNVEF